MKTRIKIETYKNIDLIYDLNDGRIYFNFEEKELVVKYAFEARQRIDEPRWEECNLEGYFIDGTFDDFIGKTKAIKKDTKSKKPYWKFRGKFDLEYKDPNNWREAKVYPKNNSNDNVYREWKQQRKIVLEEERKSKSIINKLK